MNDLASPEERKSRRGREVHRGIDCDRQLRKQLRQTTLAPSRGDSRRRRSQAANFVGALADGQSNRRDVKGKIGPQK